MRLRATGAIFRALVFLCIAVTQLANGAPQRVRVVDASGTRVAHAAVYADEVAARLEAPLPSKVAIDQINKQFEPHLVTIQAGTEVEFPNSDIVSHHVYSFSQPNAFELPLYKGENRPTVKFEHPGIVVLGCNIHDSMLGYIVVVDSPVHGVTDENGEVVLEQLPLDASYSVWWPGRGLSAPVEASITAAAAPDAVLVLNLSELAATQGKSSSGSLEWDDY